MGRRVISLCFLLLLGIAIANIYSLYTLHTANTALQVELSELQEQIRQNDAEIDRLNAEWADTRDRITMALESFDSLYGMTDEIHEMLRSSVFRWSELLPELEGE